MSGRAGRKEGLKAYCLLLSDKKPKDLDLSCNEYRTQIETCRRASLAKYFPGLIALLLLIHAFFTMMKTVFAVQSHDTSKNISGSFLNR